MFIFIILSNIKILSLSEMEKKTWSVMYTGATITQQLKGQQQLSHIQRIIATN